MLILLPNFRSLKGTHFTAFSSETLIDAQQCFGVFFNFFFLVKEDASTLQVNQAPNMSSTV